MIWTLSSCCRMRNSADILRSTLRPLSVTVLAPTAVCINFGTRENQKGMTIGVHPGVDRV